MNSKNLYNRSFKPLLKRAGLPDIRFHDLRHTCATMRFKMGQHPKHVCISHPDGLLRHDNYLSNGLFTSLGRSPWLVKPL
jgi:integrase